MAESFEVFEGEFAGEVAVERKRGREGDAEFRQRRVRRHKVVVNIYSHQFFHYY